MSASIAEAANGATQAANGADQLSAGAREAAAGARQLSDGANELEGGLVRLERGNARLEAGLARLAEASPRLAEGLEQISNGADQLNGGIGQLADGSGQLAGGLGEGYDRSAPLESGLADGAQQVGDTRDQLTTARVPSSSSAGSSSSSSSRRASSSRASSAVSAFDGARALDRDSSTFLLDSERSGGRVARVEILPNVPTNDPRTERIVDDVTDATEKFEKRSGLEAAVGGTAGRMINFDRTTGSKLPLLIAMICLVTYLMLVPILRSLLLPAIAVILNMVTVAAAFGVLSLLFVGDNPPLGGAGSLDVLSAASVFVIMFALSIDYQVFLLTRMREEFVRTQSNDDAIQFGIDKTAKVVTSAAAIMIAVFTAFALSDFVILKQFGVGLAVAILIDATIVRLALLPAVMRLFGLNTWWIPNWLDDKLPVMDVEGSEFEHELQSRPAPA